MVPTLLRHGTVARERRRHAADRARQDELARLRSLAPRRLLLIVSGLFCDNVREAIHKAKDACNHAGMLGLTLVGTQVDVSWGQWRILLDVPGDVVSNLDAVRAYGGVTSAEWVGVMAP